MHDVGAALAPAAPALVVHAEADDLVPVSDCIEYCRKNDSSAGGRVAEFMVLAPKDDRGDVNDHSLYNWAKPDATCARSMEVVIKEWFLCA